MDILTNQQKGLGEIMSTQARAAMRETARDCAVVAAFGFWAVMIGFVPVVALHALIA